jgi:replicative DNA helicase
MNQTQHAPHNLAAEQAVLGIILSDNQAVDRMEGLEGRHFYDPFHGRLFDETLALIKIGRAADPLVMAARMANDEAVKEEGGIKYFSDLFASAPPSANARSYADTLLEVATQRDLLRACDDVRAAIVSAESKETGDIALEAEKAFTEIARGGLTKDAWHDGETALGRAYDRARAGNGLPGTATGISSLDAVLGGMRPATLNLFAGRPGMGKSAVGVQAAISVAKSGKGAAFFSLEMPEEQCSVRFGASLAYDRMAPVYSGVSDNPTFEQFERGSLTPDQWRRLDRGVEAMKGLPISLDFRSRLKVSQMTAAIRRQVRKWAKAGIEPGVVVIDHFLHIASEAGQRGEAAERYTAIANDLLHMAKVLNIPIMLLCQLNRGVEGRDDKRPSLADLKWTGALEENAFSATFLYRPEYYCKPPVNENDDMAWDKYQAEKSKVAKRLFFIVEKNRGGRSNEQIETFCDIGCNAIMDLECGH